MKRIVLSIIVTTSLFAMPSINQENKSSYAAEKGGNKGYTNAKNYSESKAQNRSNSFDRALAKSKSRSWSKTISKNKGYTLTKNGLLAANLDVLPIIFDRVAVHFPNAPQVIYVQTLKLSDLGFKGMGSKYFTNNMKVNWFNSLAQRNGRVEAYEDGAERQMKYVFKNVYQLADVVDYVSKILKEDTDLNALNLEEKIDAAIPAAVKAMNRNNGYGDYDIDGKCYFISPKAWTCNREFTLELDNANRPILAHNSKVIWGHGLVNGHSLNMSVTLGHSLSEGLQLAEADRRSRDEVASARHALTLVKTSGKTKSNLQTLTKALNKIAKQSGDRSINRTLSTNPIK